MVYSKFVIGNQPSVYEPNEFMELCRQAGAPNIFNHILQAITDDRHSNKRQDLIAYEQCQLFIPCTTVAARRVM